MHTYQSLALYRGKAYVPSIGTAPSGLIYEVNPVTVIDPTVSNLAKVLAERLAAKPGKVKEWYRGDPPRKSVVQLAAKSPSWIGFARQSLRFALIGTAESWEVSVGEGASRGDVESSRLPRDAGPEDLAEAILEVASRRQLWVANEQGRRTSG